MCTVLRRTLTVIVCMAALPPLAFEARGQIFWPPDEANEPLLRVVNREGQTGFIDKTGKLVIGFDVWPKGTAAVGEFREGLATISVKKGGRPPGDAPDAEVPLVGYVDATGRVVIEPRYNYAFDFHRGLAYFVSGNSRGYIDRRGQVVVDLDRDCAGGPGHVQAISLGVCVPEVNLNSPNFQFEGFVEGLAASANGFRKGAKYGFVNRLGELVIPYRFEPRFGHHGNLEYMGHFSEGLAAVKLGERYGYIDKKGDFVIPPQFVSAEDFSEGLAYAADGTRVGYIDRAGRWVIDGKDWISPGSKFKEGLAAVHFRVKSGDGKTERYLAGYINQTGLVVIEPRFDSAGDFTNGVAKVYIAAVLGVPWECGFGYIDHTGKYIWEPRSVAKISRGGRGSSR